MGYNITNMYGSSYMYMQFAKFTKEVSYEYRITFLIRGLSLYTCIYCIYIPVVLFAVFLSWGLNVDPIVSSFVLKP